MKGDNMIGIIGSGTMGKGIAIEFAKHGHNVILVSAQRHLDIQNLKDEVEKVAKKFKISNIEELLTNIKFCNHLEDLKGCNLIIEAVSEDLAIKRLILKEAIKFSSTNSVFASNTSSLSIETIFEGIVDFRKVIGLHFFNPVQIMKLVELSYLEETDESIVNTNKNLITALGKEVVVVKNSPGFIVNRLLIPMINEASKIFDEGIATKEDIDKAMKFGANHPMGPLKLSDLIGNDVTLAILESLKGCFTSLEVSKSLYELNKNDKLGRKTKLGFYNYE